MDCHMVKLWILTNWAKTYSSNSPGGKAASAHMLTPPQIEAVAAFLSYEK